MSSSTDRKMTQYSTRSKLAIRWFLTSVVRSNGSWHAPWCSWSCRLWEEKECLIGGGIPCRSTPWLFWSLLLLLFIDSVKKQMYFKPLRNFCRLVCLRCSVFMTCLGASRVLIVSSFWIWYCLFSTKVAQNDVLMSLSISTRACVCVVAIRISHEQKMKK